MKTALTRANAARDIALAGSWREAVAHLSHAVEVCREVEAADSNGDAKLAAAVRKAVEVEVAKIAERLGDLPHARPPQESAGESVDTRLVEAVRAAKAVTLHTPDCATVAHTYEVGSGEKLPACDCGGAG